MTSTSDGGGPNNSIADENMLDDLMQNNVLFEEDEKPKAKEDEEEDLDNGNDRVSDISETDDASPTRRGSVQHSDISEDEGPELKSEIKDDEASDEGVAPNHSSDGDEQSPAKRHDETPSPRRLNKADSSDESVPQVGKKPTLASTIVRPPDSQVRKKKSKSYDYATKLNYLFRDARFFMVKSSVPENIDISKDMGVWSTPPANESRFDKAFRESRNVLLIFSVKESGKFCGFARLASEARSDVTPAPWILPRGLSGCLKSTFQVQWINKTDLPFKHVQHLQNPWNENKPIKIGRDGQEIEPSVAEELCRLFSIDNDIDMTPILRKSKESARQQRLRPAHERTNDVPHSRPIADRARPVSSPNNRKRHFPKDSPEYYKSGPNPKYARRGYHNSPPRRPGTRPQYRERYGPPPRSYEESMRSARSRYPDNDYSSAPRHRSYERSVDEFLRKNNDRRYRERRY